MGTLHRRAPWRTSPQRRAIGCGPALSYDPPQAAAALRVIRSGGATPDAQAELEFYLLRRLEELGAEDFGHFLTTLPGFAFESESGHPEGTFAQYVDASEKPELAISFARPADPDLVDAMTFINVEVAAEAEPEGPQEPDHRAFYQTWEIVGLLDEPPSESRHWDRAVFLVGLLEAELMNGGFGQYLTNTDGLHLEATLKTLNQMGAELTSGLLERAAALASEATSFAEAWDEHSESFGILDSQFLAATEDLAALCCARYAPHRHSK